MVRTHTGHQAQALSSTRLSSSHGQNLGVSYTSRTTYPSGKGFLAPTLDQNSMGAFAKSSSQTNHQGRYTLLSTKHQSNYGSQNNLGQLQFQTTFSDKAYANRSVGVSTTYQMANTSLIAQVKNSEPTDQPFSDLPEQMNASMDFPIPPADPPVPLGNTTALLIFGLGFVLIKVVWKKR